MIARAISENIINFDFCNWREDYGVGNYRQVDDRPYGGGAGMVLKADPVFDALSHYEAVSTMFENESQANVSYLPNNSLFYSKCLANNKVEKATIMLTPRGFPFNQSTSKWLSGFKELNILCGRYEGFDARLSNCVDLELSIGDYVLNGGEVAAMSLVEAVSRLLPGFVTKPSVIHNDSFSKISDKYHERDRNLFDNSYWVKSIMPKIEHPQYTRPYDWKGWKVPDILLSGNHQQIRMWQQSWL
ncbi:MAG: hypothetical protein AAGF07_00690 [Patescibacteria group bacterium]